MTGYRAFSYEFVKGFPVLSKGFEIETEMTIHAVDKNFKLVEIPVTYRDRPKGSASKLNMLKKVYLLLPYQLFYLILNHTFLLHFLLDMYHHRQS